MESLREIIDRVLPLLSYDPQAPMLFSSGLFLFLFAAFAFFYGFMRRTPALRIWYVIAFSLYFYYKSSGIYLLLLVGVSVSDFWIGRAIAHVGSRRAQRALVALSIAADLAVLGYFKYTNFFIEIARDLFGAGFLEFQNIFLPVGISFFLFQSLSYTIDIYRGSLKPVDRWGDYLFYLSFFPQLVAGPIVRARDFLVQIRQNPIAVSREMFGTGIYLITIGLFKKAVISDYISLNFVDRIFDDPALYSGMECLAAVYGYALQIYCDFSGYSDMAIGLALLRPVALLLGATPELLPSCLLYGRILLTFQTAFMLQYLFQSFFIAAEKPKLGLFFTVAAGVTNMVLDFVLVGVAGLGLAGAASATVISQMVGGVAPIFYFAKRRPGCRLYFTKPLFSLRELFKACTNGISELMTNISMSLVGALYNMQLLKLFGADGVAAYGVLMYVGFVFAAVFIGYSQGTAPIVSYHFGADNKDELKNLLRKSAGIIAVAGVAMLTSSELLAEPLAKIFVGYDAGLLALTTHGMKLYCISFILSGFNIFGSAFFTALNNGTVSAAISFLRTLLFQVVSILTLPLIIGVDGIWLAVVAAEAMALVCTGGFVVRGRKRYGYL